MKNHFYIAYTGNKRNEFNEIETYINKIFDNFENNIDTIIEPFCGSCAFSYCISLKHPKKFKYILNDMDENLIYLLNAIKNENSRLDLEKNINEKLKNIKNKDDYNNLEGFYRWFIHNKYYYIRPGLYPPENKFKNINLNECPFTKFILNENIEFINMDGRNLIQKYYNDETKLIFVDPPYIISCNALYTNKTGLNIYEWFYNNKINDSKCWFIIVLEDNWIINLLFNENIKHSYNKLYQHSKKKTKHLIITNY